MLSTLAQLGIGCIRGSGACGSATGGRAWGAASRSPRGGEAQLFLTLTLLLSSSVVWSADAASGSYVIGGGVGSVDCPKFTETMERARAAGLGTLTYVTETAGFQMYVAGFQTAYNRQTPKTCDVFGGFTSDQLLAWLDNYCKAHPLDRFGSAVIALAKEAHPRRLQTCK